MARPTKVSLDYFACDVRILDDPKIALVIAEHGPIVANVIIRLLGEIYGGEGYYISWDDDRAALFAFNTCHGAVTLDQTKAIIASLIKRGFFDGEIYARTGKLTSHGIQSRWEMAIKSTHRTCEIDPEICLIDRGANGANDCPENRRGNSGTRASRVSSEETRINSEKTTVLSEKTPLKKRKEKKSNYLQTNQQTRASEPDPDTPRRRSPLLRDDTDSSPPKKPPMNPIRAEIVRILVKPGDYSIDRDLIDRTYKAIREGVPGLDPDNLRKISRKADAEVSRWDRTDGRSGKRYRWQTITDEIHARFRAANRPWSDEFAGENEPPPPRRNAPSGCGETSEGKPPVGAADDPDELIAQLRDRRTDPTGETLEQTARRLKCSQEDAYLERETWRTLKKIAEARAAALT